MVKNNITLHLHFPVKGKTLVEKNIPLHLHFPVREKHWLNNRNPLIFSSSTHFLQRLLYIKLIKMSNTYTQMHFQFVFAVQNRISLIQPQWRDKLYAYITGTVQNHNHKMIIINGMADHLHLVVGMRPTQSVSDLLKCIKKDSSQWINDNKFTQGKFNWQEGYGAFTYKKSDLPFLIEYVKNQEDHHHIKSFLDEYRDLLQEFKMEYDERYIFRTIE